MQVTSSEFREDINALRAFAVISVVGFHLGIPGFGGGFSGVDVFLVISGFLISSQILTGMERGDFSFKLFYASRVRRIVPALVVVCVVCFLFGWFMDLPKEFIQHNRHILSALLFVSNIAFNGERGYFDSAADTKALLHTWSLSVEAQFYLLLPLVLWGASRWGTRVRRTAVLALASISFGWMVYQNTRTEGSGFYLLTCRAWEFLVGTALASYGSFEIRSSRWAKAGVILGVVGLLLAATLTSHPANWPGLATLIPVVAAALIIGSGRQSRLQTFFRLAPLQWCGNVSYSLYLWHWPLWVFATAWATGAGRRTGLQDIIIVLMLSLACAWLSWRYVEQPVRYNRSRWTSRRLLSTYAAAVISSFFVGAYVLINQGLPSRFGEYVRRAAEATFMNTPRDECFRQGDSGKTAPEEFCRMGSDQGEAQLILWGDSHANQYQTAVSMAAGKMNVGGLIATQSGCSARLVEQVIDQDGACTRFNHEVWTYLLAHPEVRWVVIGKWWAPDTDIDLTINLIKTLTRNGRRVLLLGPLPAPGFDVPDRWARQQVRSGAPIDELSSDITEQSNVYAMTNALRLALQSEIQSHQVSLLEPTAKLCDERRCWWVDHGQSNFRDESHLSHAASLKFTEEIYRGLNRLNDPRR